MNNDNENKYQPEIDTSALEAGVKRATVILTGIGDAAATEAARLENVMAGIGERAENSFDLSFFTLLVNEVGRLDTILHQTHQQLSGVLGSTEKASEVLKELQSYSTDSIFNLEELSGATVQLMELGHTAEEVITVLDSLSNISVGTDSSLQEWMVIYSRTREGDMVNASVLTEWAARGVNALGELARMFNSTEEQISKMVVTGEVGIKEMIQLIKNLGQGTGSYANSMKEQMKVVRNSLEDVVKLLIQLAEQINSMDFSPGKEDATLVESLTATYRNLMTLLGDVNTVADFISNLKNLNNETGIVTKSITVLTAAQNKLSKAWNGASAAMKGGIYGAAAVALAAVGYSIYKLVSSTNEMEKAQKRLNETTKDFHKSTATEQLQIQRLFQELGNAKEGTEEYERAKKNILDQFGDYLSNMDTETRLLLDQEKAYKAVSEAALKAARNKAVEKIANDEMEEYGDVHSKNITKLHDSYKGRNKENTFLRLKEQINSGTRIADMPKDIQNSLHANEKRWVNNILAARQKALANIDKANVSIGNGSTRKSNTGSSLIEYATDDPVEMVKQVETRIKSKEAEIQALRDGKKRSQKVLDALKEKEQELSGYHQEFRLLTGKSYDGGMKSPDDNNNQQIADFQTHLANQQRAEITARKRMQLEVDQERLNLMEDGYEKTKKQNDLNLEKELLDVESRANELILKEQEEQRRVWEANGKEGVFTPTVNSRAELSAANKVLLGQMDITAGEKHTQAEERADIIEKEKLDARLKEFENFQAQRLRIAEEYSKKIAQFEKDKEKAEKEGDAELVERIQQAIGEATLRMTADLAEIDDKIKTSGTTLVDIFSDMSERSIGEIRAIAEQAEELKKLLEEGVWDKDIQVKFGITREQFEHLSQDEQGMKNLGEQIRNVQRGADKAQNAFGKMGTGMKKMFAAGSDKKNFEEGFELMNEGMQKAIKSGKELSGAIKNIGDATGSEALGEVANGINDAMDIAGGAMDGAQMGMSVGGPMGAAVGAAVGLASSLGGKLAENAAHRKMLREQIRKNQMEDYLAEMDMNRLWRERYDWAQKIGESTLSHIKRQGTELNKQTAANAKEQDELMAKLMGEQYKANEYFKKTGLFGLGKGKIKEEWESLAGKSWEEIELFAAQGKLSEDGQKYYEALKKAREEGEDLAKRQEEYLEMVRETFTGSSYDSIVDGIVEGFKAGKRSANDFAETFESLMENAVAASLKLLTDEKMRKWYEGFAEKAQEGLTDRKIEEAREEYMELVEQLAKEAEALERVTGVAIGEASRTASTKGIATASQESVDELNGRFTAIQAHTYNMNENVQVLANNSSTVLKHLAGIETNTQHCQRLETIENDMRSVKYELQEINLKGITLKK